MTGKATGTVTGGVDHDQDQEGILEVPRLRSEPFLTELSERIPGSYGSKGRRWGVGIGLI